MVDVTAPVEDVDVDLPRLRQLRERRGARRFGCALALLRAAGQHEHRDERGEGRRNGEQDREPRARVRLERQRRDRKAGELLCLAPVDPERGRVEQEGEQRVVRRAEAVDAALLEPRHLVLGQPRFRRRLAERQLTLKPRTGERGTACFEWGCELHGAGRIRFGG